MKRWAEIKRKLLADKKALALIAVFLAGLMLFALSGASGGSDKKETDYNAAVASLEKSLEARAEKLLGAVDGVGRVKVLVTLENLQEFRCAENTLSEEDAQRTKTEYVIVENSGEKTGLVLTVVSPKVRGVAVTCEGGASARVRQEVTNLICAAFDVGAAKVYVSAYTNE